MKPIEERRLINDVRGCISSEFYLSLFPPELGRPLFINVTTSFLMDREMRLEGLFLLKPVMSAGGGARRNNCLLGKTEGIKVVISEPLSKTFYKRVL